MKVVKTTMMNNLYNLSDEKKKNKNKQGKKTTKHPIAVCLTDINMPKQKSCLFQKFYIYPTLVINQY